MQCRRIRLRDFRNIAEADVTFSPGVNLLHGENAQGKTNLLEALYYTAIGKTFRTGHDEELIRFGAESATVENYFSSDALPADRQTADRLTVRLLRGRGGRSVDRNGVRARSMSEVIGLFRVVLFCPSHLSVVQGSPEDRRDFLNVAISQLRPLYVRELKLFNRALKERNALLRQAQDAGGRLDETAEMWSAQLAGACANIAAKRAAYVLRLDALMKECFADMTDNREIPGVGYVNSLGLPAQEMLSPEQTKPEFFRLLTERTAREIGAGSTLYGVHRDDLLLTLNDRPARLYASQGQQRSLALSMKLAEGTISGQETGGDLPVFLFDDVLSELDGRRRAYLLRELTGRQVIMTCCEDISSSLPAASFRSIRVENGRYVEP